MSSIKQLRHEEKTTLESREVIQELNALVMDIDRCEKTMTSLKSELDGVNAKFKGPRTTREDIDYLTALLKCANKKLTWEKHMASLQKRTPAILEKITRLMNEPIAPPPESTRIEMVQCLQGVQAAMDRLQNVKT